MGLNSHGSDVLIFGAGVMGLSIALELRRRGASVTLTDKGVAGEQASSAAAGMLAVHDPHNPPQLLALAQLSANAYPEYLRRVGELSGLRVPLQTRFTRQTLVNGQVLRIAEDSLDPRQLLPALRQAVLAADVRLRERDDPSGALGGKEDAGLLKTDAVIYTTGAWAARAAVFPRKGQMLRVRMPGPHRLDEVYRAEHMYIVPRTQGPQAGTALIGATVEDAGFDLTTDPQSLAELRRHAAELVPEIGDAAIFPAVESWAGLRPATPDGLPLLGHLPSLDHLPSVQLGKGSPTVFIAAGHYRNGILLAPGTALVMADLVQGHRPAIDTEAFSPARFGETS